MGKGLFPTWLYNLYKMNRFHATTNFLYDACNILPSTSAYNVIRSNILQKYLGNLTRLKNEILIKCALCGVNFNDVTPLHQITPSKLCNRFDKRLLKTDDNSKSVYQIKCVKKLRKQYRKQILVKKCRLCKKIYKTPFNKPNTLPKVAEIEIPNDKSKKKKRKYDKFCGLNASVILSQKRSSVIDIKDSPVQPSKRQKLNNGQCEVVDLNTSTVSEDESVIIIDSTPKNSKVLFPKTSTPKNNASNITLKNSSLKKKAKNKKNNIKKPRTPNIVLAKIEKENTKTKKLNSLALLMKSSQDNKANDAKSRLTNFLKSFS